jgi:hypothetical protein
MGVGPTGGATAAGGGLVLPTLAGGRENIRYPNHRHDEALRSAAAGTGSGRKSGSPRRRRTPLDTTEDVAPGTEPDVSDQPDAANRSDFLA